MRISDLQMKKIINISSGKSIGNIVDVNVLEDGRIESFVIDSSKAFFSFNKEIDSFIDVISCLSFWFSTSKASISLMPG